MSNCSDEFLSQLVGRMLVLFEQDEGGNDFSPCAVRTPDNAAFGHGRMFQAGTFDFNSADTMSGDFDDLIRSSTEPDIAIIVDMCRVTAVVHITRNLAPVIATVALRLSPQ